MPFIIRFPLLLATLAIVTAGCTGVGYIATSDPKQKITQSYQLMAEDRMLLAEDVIGQALEIFESQGDKAGMAEAYHAYGNLYKNDQYINGRWTTKFKELGTYDGTYSKSIENFAKCEKLYEDIGDGAGAAKCLLGAGNAHGARGDRQSSCQLYERALSRYENAKQTEEGFVEPRMLTGYANMGELISAFIEHAPCGI